MRHANHCDHCHGPLALSMMSKCNRDTLCTRCQNDECEAPGYAAAAATEVTAVRAGDDNFPGTGLSPRARKYLAARRVARKSHTTV
jgi:hypothetical protein